LTGGAQRNQTSKITRVADATKIVIPAKSCRMRLVHEAQKRPVLAPREILLVELDQALPRLRAKQCISNAPGQPRVGKPLERGSDDFFHHSRPRKTKRAGLRALPLLRLSSYHVSPLDARGRPLGHFETIKQKNPLARIKMPCEKPRKTQAFLHVLEF